MKHIKKFVLLCGMFHNLLCADDCDQKPTDIDHKASDSDPKRYYYVHQNQLRQQLLQITGPTYNAASMNLAALYQLATSNSILVNSATCGNVTLGSMVNSSTMGNLTLATLIEQMQSYAYLTATSLTNFTIAHQSPSGLISTNGTTITFNVDGTYMLIGSFNGRVLGAQTFATFSFTDNFSGGTPSTYSTPLVNLASAQLAPMSFAYREIYNITAGNTISFTRSPSQLFVSTNVNVHLTIIRLT